MGPTEIVEFIPTGLIEGPAPPVRPDREPMQQPATAACTAGSIEMALPKGVRVSVDACVSAKALPPVLRAMKGVA